MAPKKNRDAFDEMFCLAYEELRRLAGKLNQSPNRTLNPTALVNEAWLRLVNGGSSNPVSMAHFRAVAARAMRHVLIDAARRKGAAKRGGAEDHRFLPLIETLDGLLSWDRDLIALNDALEELEQADPRQAKIVEFRYFGGYSVSETAELLGVAESTVLRDWQTSRAWLKTRIKRGN